jgi:hypothetical protein
MLSLRARDPLFTNLLRDKHFDQIAFHDPKRYAAKAA